jgi:predicted NodU family carbamoyl transferase
MAELYLGTARARLGPAAALIDLERGAVAACEENRLTRAVDSGTTGPPQLAIAELLRFLGRQREDVRAAGGVAEEGDIDAHKAHATYALKASGFRDPLIVVCGSEFSAWHGETRLELGATPEFTKPYATLVEQLGFRPRRDEHLVEALARGGHDEAAAVQQRLGDTLLAVLEALRTRTNASHVCLSGGLFFNTYFTSRVAASALFDDVYVPPHPGRNGAALGAALLLANGGDVSSPYLGPSYPDQEIKSTLENCKLSFDLLHEERVIEIALHQLARGRLVGWYHGRLEWGPRALGHRSVLADPFAPHVLENLNGFLKRRPAFRAYGVSVPAHRLDDIFEPGARRSPFMQFEYRPRDLQKFRTILPAGVRTLRVHTVDESTPRFLRLLEVWGERTGTPVLVNTSFNGFHEPLVCSPRDAIRVFYGTGLDILALENFLLRK